MIIIYLILKTQIIFLYFKKVIILNKYLDFTKFFVKKYNINRIN